MTGIIYSNHSEVNSCECEGAAHTSVHRMSIKGEFTSTFQGIKIQKKENAGGKSATVGTSGNPEEHQHHIPILIHANVVFTFRSVGTAIVDMFIVIVPSLRQNNIFIMCALSVLSMIKYDTGAAIPVSIRDENSSFGDESAIFLLVERIKRRLRRTEHDGHETIERDNSMQQEFGYDANVE
uniref:Uncharacterized protein n=1 Tax=Romanomermis culicivorax TaxID=13658 RepID=A0A915I0S7_ROMCU